MRTGLEKNSVLHVCDVAQNSQNNLFYSQILFVGFSQLKSHQCIKRRCRYKHFGPWSTKTADNSQSRREQSLSVIKSNQKHTRPPPKTWSYHSFSPFKRDSKPRYQAQPLFFYQTRYKVIIWNSFSCVWDYKQIENTNSATFQNFIAKNDEEVK